MKILLDECLPRKLKFELPGHDVATVSEIGWSGRTNGELLRLAEPRFDAFITIDRGVKYQQNLRSKKLAVIQLAALDNRFETLRPLMAQVLQTLETIRPGEIVQVSG